VAATNHPSAIHELPATTERMEQYGLVFVKSGAKTFLTCSLAIDNLKVRRGIPV
jgi:hypothetical protein